MFEFRTRLRRLLRQPTYIVSVLVSLGLGTAVSVAAFSFVNALIFRPLPGIADRRGLIRLDWARGDRRLTTAEFRALTEQRPLALAPLAAQGTRPLPIMLGSRPETLSVAFVSERFFDTLGTRPVIGRLLRAADADPSAAPVAVISERLWRRAFDGSSAILQDSLTIAARPFPLVGVAPDRFAGLRIVDLGGRDSDYPDVWICLRDAALWPSTARPTAWLAVAARLAPGAALASARSELDVIGPRLAGSHTEGSAPPRTLRAYRGGLDWRDEPSQSLLTLALFLFIPLSVLGIGCVNVINLQLARSMDESAELSLRVALGASQWRIARLLLAEVAVVATLSTALGCAGAHVLLRRAGAVLPVPPAIDPAAMGFAALLVTAVVGAAGLLPAWWSSRDVVATGLRELRDASPMRARFRNVLIVIQVAASVVLLALTGLGIRSLVTRAPAASPTAREVLTAAFDFRATAADNTVRLFMTAMEERLRDAASIRGVAFATFDLSPGTMRYGRGSDLPGVDHSAFGGYVTPQWFAVTGAKFLAGNMRPDFPRGTAVVNRALASILTGGAPNTAVGMPIRADALTSVEVTGVVDDTHVDADGRPLPMLYRPMAVSTAKIVALLVLATDLPGARRAVTDAVTELDPTLPLASLPTLDDKARDLSSGLREMLALAATLGLLSVALAGAGLHSLLSYAVRRRRREIGIRMALGARSQEIVRLAVAPALWLVVAGAVAGLAIAVPIAAVIRASVLGVSPIDPRGLLPTVAILAAVAVVSAAGPTLHAIRIDPIDALREE